MITSSRLKSLRCVSARLCSNEVKWHKPVGAHYGVNIYNCVGKRKVPLILPNDSYATWYTCGPTVYDSSHLGHASCYVKLDIIQRILRNHFHINLVTAMNITDIDDKIIQRSIETGKDWQDIVNQYEEEFWLDLKKLNVAPPLLTLRVTQNISKIVAFIEEIIEKGLAYVGNDRSVYFNVSKFPNYGKLQKVNTPTDEDAGQHDNKHSVADFALWKAKKGDNEPSWSSPWGEGRPGWHIECSTLASQIFGSSLDFHAGGLDLRFPHHENEEAQCCVYHDKKQWVNYWLHTGQLNVKGESAKMSKSLKNTISIAEMLRKYGADEFRMACLLSHYRNPMEYSDELMETATNTLRKFKTFNADCQAYFNGMKSASHLDSNIILKNLNYAMNEVNAALEDDFNTAFTVSLLLDQTTSISRCINSSSETDLVESSYMDVVGAVYNFVQNTLSMYGCANVFEYHTVQLIDEEKVNISNILTGIINSRSTIRERAVIEKNEALFKICDEMRKSLLQHGVEVRDHNKGSSWNFVSEKKRCN